MIFLLASSLLVSNAFADVPYCVGEEVSGEKSAALQQVIKSFAEENNCVIGNQNCIHNFDSIKYHISWSEDCIGSARRGNDPTGSTFICDNGVCHPFGFNYPRANY